MKKVEPTFLGMPCTGSDAGRTDSIRENIRCLELLADFFTLDRKDQLLMAALVTQMVDNSESKGQLA